MAAFLALLSSLLWGTGDFLGGTLARRRPALFVTLASQPVGLALLLVVATVLGSWNAEPGYWPWAVAAGLLGLAGIVAFYTALADGTMGIVAPTAALSVLVPLAVALFRGEQPASLQVLGIVLAIGGVILASGPELSAPDSTRPVFLALLSALLFGLMFVAVAEGSRHDAVMTMVGMRLTTLLIAVGVVAVRRTLGGISKADIGMLVAIGVFDTGANLAWAFATTVGLLSVTAVLGSLYPVVTAVLAAAVHKERLRLVQYAGVVLAMLGVCCISLG